MSAREFWRVIFVGCLLLGGLSVCSGMIGGRGSGEAGASTADVDLEALMAEWKRHAASGSQDLAPFEAAVNDSRIYSGEGRVQVTLKKDGSVIGYVDGDGVPGHVKGADKLVFRIEADQPNSRLIASDRYQRHHQSPLGTLAGIYLVSRMMGLHHGYYGGWRAYPYNRYVNRGYYHGARRSARWGSRSSWGGRSGRRSSGGGGFRGGK